MNTQAKKTSIKTMTFGAMLTALVVVLQLMGSFIKFGPFSISLVLIPIVIGAATCGPYIGAWLGAVFGVTVLASGDAAAFMTVSAIGTVVTVMLKGIASGFLAGITYKLIEKKNQLIAVIAAAVVCPLVNTGIFLAGCVVFFMDTIKIWAEGAGFGGNVVGYMFIGLVGGNFLFELGANLLLSPTIVKLLDFSKKNI